MPTNMVIDNTAINTDTYTQYADFVFVFLMCVRTVMLLYISLLDSAENQLLDF